MNHIGGIIADCVLQVGHRWETHVEPRVKRIIITYPSAATISGLLNLLKTHSAKTLINWNGIDEQKRFVMTVNFFHNEKVNTVNDLYKWLQTGNNRDRLISKSTLPNKAGIPKISDKTADYYRVLVGISDAVAIDKLLKDFMRKAGIQGYGYMKLRSIIQLTAQHLSNSGHLVNPIDLDRSIWEYQSKQNPGTKKSNLCGYSHRNQTYSKGVNNMKYAQSGGINSQKSSSTNTNLIKSNNVVASSLPSKYYISIQLCSAVNKQIHPVKCIFEPTRKGSMYHYRIEKNKYNTSYRVIGWTSLVSGGENVAIIADGLTKNDPKISILEWKPKANYGKRPEVHGKLIKIGDHTYEAIKYAMIVAAEYV